MTDGQVRELIDAIKESGGSKNDIFGKGEDSERFREKVVKVVAKTDEDELRDRISREGKQHSLMTAAMDKTTGFVRTVVEKIKGAFETVTGFIGGIFNVLPFGGLLKGAAIIGGMILGWKKLQPFLDKPEIKDWFSNFFDGVFKVVNGIIRWFWNTFTAGEKLDENWDVRDWAKNKYTQIMNGRSIPEFLWDMFANTTSKIASWLTGKDISDENIKEGFIFAYNEIETALTTVVDATLDIFSGIYDWITELHEMMLGLRAFFEYEARQNLQRWQKIVPVGQMAKFVTTDYGDAWRAAKKGDVKEFENAMEEVYGEFLMDDENPLGMNVLKGKIQEMSYHDTFGGDKKQVVLDMLDKVEQARKQKRIESAERSYERKHKRMIKQGGQWGYDENIGSVSSENQKTLERIHTLHQSALMSARESYGGLSQTEVDAITKIASSVNSSNIDNSFHLTRVVAQLEKLNKQIRSRQIK